MRETFDLLPMKAMHGAVPALTLVVLAMLAQPAWTQVPDEVRARLGRNSAVTTSSWVYASATGPLRGSREVSEDLQATRAMREAARALCNFDPAPGKSLEAGITGFTMMSSVVRGREVEVVMRAPMQKPICRVVVAPLSAAATAPALAAAPPRLASPTERAAGDPSTQLLKPAYIRSSDMTIRIFGVEY